MNADARPKVRLGLIGDNIARSRSPALHRIAGELNGLDVSYDLFIPRDLGRDFDAVFNDCRAAGLRGVNVTYPYKEQAASRVVTPYEVRRIGSVNTVIFEEDRALGFNTDCSGFVAAYRGAFGETPPGRVAMIGAGGVGKAVAYGLVSLGAEAIAIIDRDHDKAAGLASALSGFGIKTSVHGDVEEAVRDADGVVNCTPVGMAGYPGTPVPRTLLARRRWAFDAVYTPVNTIFSREAEAEGLVVISGYELFFNQGVHAFEIFTGRLPADLPTLRGKLADGDDD